MVPLFPIPSGVFTIRQSCPAGVLTDTDVILMAFALEPFPSILAKVVKMLGSNYYVNIN